jgi:hypothetical protein
VARRRVFAIAFSLALLTLISSGGSGGAASEATAKVVVIASAVVPEAEEVSSGGYGYSDYGLVLRNLSLTQDAINVAVEVEAVDDSGRELTDDYAVVTLIPAGRSFVLSGALIWRGSVGIGSIDTEVRVGRSAPRRRRLPPVRQVSITSSGSVIGSFTNQYKKPLPESATIYGVVIDSGGRIVGAGYDVTDAVTRPGATAGFHILKTSTTAKLDAGNSAKVSVDPCGYLALTSDCPVPGAQR